METQSEMCFTYEESIGADIKALGGNKKVAARLWPAEDGETAHNRIKACLAPGHKQKFSPHELLTLKKWARDVGSYATVNYEAAELSFRVEWVAPEDEDALLKREFISAVDKLAGVQSRIEANEKRLKVRR